MKEQPITSKTLNRKQDNEIRFWKYRFSGKYVVDSTSLMGSNTHTYNWFSNNNTDINKQ